MSRQRVHRPPEYIRNTAPAKPDRVVFIVDRLCGLAKTIARAAAFFGVFWCLKETIEDLAGQTTSAKIDINGGVSANGSLSAHVFASRYASQIVFALFGVTGIGYGYHRKRLHNNVVAKLKRLEYLEKKLDRGRSSSGISQ